MTTTEVAVSTPEAVACAHCGKPMMQSGILGGWAVRTCPDRICRDRSDGAWNMMYRINDVVVSIALPRRLARGLCSGLTGQDLRAASGGWWHGPVGEEGRP